MDHKDLKNYSLLVSNLPYIGKLIEKVAIDQINIHLPKYHLHEPLQSPYTTIHSTDTAVVKVTNDILRALDCRQCVYLVLDLSAAFNTKNPRVFLLRLLEDYVITGDVTDWMESYLNNRSQAIDKLIMDGKVTVAKGIYLNGS